MPNFDPVGMCMMCRDRKRAEHALSDARRIFSHLDRLLEPGRKQNARPIYEFHTPVSCHWTGGCSKMSSTRHQLKSLEHQLSEVFDGLCVQIQELRSAGESEKANSLSYEVTQLVRGYYPGAVHVIERLPKKGDA